MGLHITTRFRLLPKHKLIRSVGLVFTALVVAISALTSLHVPSAKADVPLYGQELTSGFGDRRIADYGSGIAFDSTGNFFMGVGATNDNYIRKFAADGSFIKDFRISDTTGNSDIAYAAQYGRLAVDNNDLLYAINKQDSTIHVFDDNGVLQTIIPSAIVNADIVFDHSNNYYMTDAGNHRVQKYAHDGTFLYSIGGPTSGSIDGKFNVPGELAIDSNNNLVAIDKNNHRIQIFSDTGAFIRKFGQLNTALLCPAQPSLGGMAGLTLDQQDNIYVATHAAWCGNHVQKFDINGNYIATQTRPRSTSYMRLGPSNVIYDIESGSPAGYTSTTRYNTDGTAIGSQLISNPTAMARPIAIAQDSQGNTYIIDEANARVQKYDTNRNPVLTFGAYGSGDGLFQYIGDIAIDQNDIIYVTDRTGQKVQKFNTSGGFVGKFGVAGSGDGQFSGWTSDIAVRADGNLIIQDGIYSGGTRIQIMTPTGGFINKISQNGIRSFAQKSDGTITILASSGYSNYIYNYSPDGTLLNSHYNSFTDPDTNKYFTAQGNLAYDRFDNLYAVGKDTARSQYYSSSIARLNLTDEDMPGYVSVIPDIDDLANPYFTPSNQLFATDYLHDYVRIYDATTLQAPSSPQSLIAASNQTSTIDLSWQAPTSGDPILKYRLEYKPHTYGQWVKYGTTTSLSATMTGLLDNTYDVRISALNEAGVGASTEVDNIAVTSGYGYKENYTSSDSSSVNGIAFDSNGNRYESDQDNSRINVYLPDGSFDRSFGEAQLSRPGQLNISSENKLYVPDAGTDSVNIFALDGTYLNSFGTSGSGDGQMDGPDQVVIDSNDNVYVVSLYRNIQKYDKNGIFISRLAADLTDPTALAIDQDGSFYVANNVYDTDGGIIKYDANGVRLQTIIDYGWDEGDSKVSDVYTITINGRGELVMNDAYAYRIKIFSTAGQLIDAYGRGWSDTGEYMMFNDPQFSAQASNGDLYIPSYGGPFMQVLSYIGTPPAEPTIPSTPQNVTADTSTPNQAAFDWTAPADDGGAAVTQYTLEYKLSSGSTWIPVTVTAPASDYTLTSLTAGQYDARISATNNAGTGATTTPITFTVTNPNPPASAPSNPQNLTVTSPAANTITTDWQTPATDGGSALTYYTLEYKLTSSSTWTQITINTPATGHTLADIPAGSYDVRSTATNTIGTSATSNTATVTVADPIVTPVVDPPVTAPTVTITTGDVSPRNPHVTANQTTDSAPDDTTPVVTEQSVQAATDEQPGQVTISWQPPQLGDVSNYIIEYQPANGGDGSWKTAATVDSHKYRATITLPGGDYTIRVSALLPGETLTRVILGVARVKVAAAPIVSGDGPSVTSAPTPTSIEHTVRNWIVGCAASVMVASMFFIPIFWKRRRKKARSEAMQTPARRL